MDVLKKVSIIGGPGTGKSTLANNIGKVLDVPIYHLDGICHFANWEPRDKKERDEIILSKINEPKWVIEGTYTSTLPNRIENSDLVIFLQFSTISRIKGVVSRYFKLRGKERPEIPGCKEKLEFKFVKFAYNWDKTTGKKVKEILNKSNKNNILILKSRKATNDWFMKQFNKEIEV